jgi:transposase-like protein
MGYTDRERSEAHGDAVEGTVKELIKERNLRSVEDVQDCLKDLFGETIQAMLEAEMDHHLGYEKNDRVRASSRAMMRSSRCSIL